MGITEESIERLLSLRRDLDRIFRNFFDPGRPEALEEGGQVDTTTDIFETDEEIVLEIELPGVKKQDLKISVLRDVVIIEGKKPRPMQAKGIHHICMERTSGHFRRIIELPSAGDTTNIKAKLDKGLLKISMPKIEDRRGRHRIIPIS